MEYICPHCKNPIDDDDALRCLFCGELLERGSGGSRPMKWLIAVIALLVALSFLLTMIF